MVNFNCLNFRICCLFTMLSASYAFPSAASECIRPIDYPKELPCPQQAWETVQTEHEDRIARLQRLSVGLTNFEFSTTVIAPEEHQLPDYPVDIPVLRVIADAKYFFDTGSHEIRPEAYNAIYTISESLKREPPDVALFIAGHTDSRGSERYNLELGKRRSIAVSKALVTQDVYQAQIYSVSFGENLPISNNNTRRGRSQNRRVEFLFGARPSAVVNFLEKQRLDVCVSRLSDSSSSCKKVVNLDVATVKVAPSAEQKLVALQTERKMIDLDTELTPIQRESKRQEIELKTRRVPVKLKTRRVPVRLGTE